MLTKKYQILTALALISTIGQSLISMEQQKKDHEMCDLLKQKLSWVEIENPFGNTQDPVLKQKLKDLVTDIKSMIQNCPRARAEQLKMHPKTDAQWIAVALPQGEKEDPLKDSHAGAAQINNRPTIIIMQDFIKKGSREEIAFAFGHELGHIMHGDLEKRKTVNAQEITLDHILLGASLGSLVVGGQEFLRSLFNGDWLNCFIEASWVAASGYAAKKIIGKAHAQETDADIFAAELLQSADGGIHYCERAQKTPAPFLAKIATRIGKPSDAERIAALKEWQNRRKKKDDI
jgi:Zn-dependent protease with chaperone function